MAKFQKGETPDGAIVINEEIAKAYQAKSVASRLRNKHGKELVRAILELGLFDPTVRKKMAELGFNPDVVDNETAMHIRQIEKAQKTADTKAYNAVMKTAGYEEKNINLNTPVPMVISDEEAEILDNVAKDE